MKTLNEFIQIATDRVAYDDAKKRRFHRLGKAVMRMIVRELGLGESEYSISSNMGGMAVSGEVILHSDHLYVQFSQSAFLHDAFMYRTCDGRKDFCGGMNHWYKYSKLEDLSDFVGKLKELSGARNPA